MAKFEKKPELEKISIIEAKKMRKKITKQAKILQEYIKYINDVSETEAGKFKVEDNVEAFRVRSRILRAARELEVDVVVKKFGLEIVFYKGKRTVRKRKRGSKQKK